MSRFTEMLRRLLREEKGVTAALAAVFLTFMVGIMGAAVDLGAVYSAKAQLQNAADSAALAAADTMLGMGSNSKVTAQPSTGLVSAQTLAASNSALGVPTRLKTPPGNDFVIGYYDTSSRGFVSGRTGMGLTNAADLNAVQVTLRRDSQANSPISTFFARILGLDEIGVQATSIAFRGYPGTVAQGTVKIPVAIVDQDISSSCAPCNETTTYKLDNIAAWTSFSTNPNNSTTVQNYLNGHSTIPNLKVGDVIYINGDSFSNSYFDTSYSSVQSLFNAQGTDTNGDHKADYWKVVLPVISSSVTARGELPQVWPKRVFASLWGLVAGTPAYACGPTTGHTVQGFTTIKLTKLNSSDHTKASGNLVCGEVPASSTTGGGDYGSRAATSKLTH